jgi:hypothetical protein
MKNKINDKAVELIVGVAAVIGVMTITLSAIGMIVKLIFG